MKQQLPETQTQIIYQRYLSRTNTELDQQQLQLEQQYVSNLRDQRIKMQNFANEYHTIIKQLNLRNQQLSNMQCNLKNLVQIVKYKDNQIIQLSNKLQYISKNQELIIRQKEQLQYKLRKQDKEIQSLQNENKQLQIRYKDIRQRYLTVLNEKQNNFDIIKKQATYIKQQQHSNKDQSQNIRQLIMEMLQQKHIDHNPQKLENTIKSDDTINYNIVQKIEDKLNSLLQQKKLLNFELDNTKFEQKFIQNTLSNLRQKVQQLAEDKLSLEKQQQKLTQLLEIEKHKKQKLAQLIKIQTTKNEQYIEIIKILRMEEAYRRKINDKELSQLQRMQELLQQF